MKVLCIGDIVSRIGRDMIFKYAEELRYSHSIDFIIANAENASHGNGLNKSAYDELMRAGCDILTMGNHTWGFMHDIRQLMQDNANIVRPLNYSEACPGEGSAIMTAANGQKIAIINLIGRVYMSPADSPFEAAMKEVKKLREKTNIIFVDFHAEATSEKEALGFFLDGQVSAVFGTHTHVQTADDMILPKGTGYITDLGMTGPYISVLGTDKDIIIERFLTGLPNKFRVAEGNGQFCGCIFTIDDTSGLCTATERIFIRN